MRVIYLPTQHGNLFVTDIVTRKEGKQRRALRQASCRDRPFERLAAPESNSPPPKESSERCLSQLTRSGTAGKAHKGFGDSFECPEFRAEREPHQAGSHTALFPAGKIDPGSNRGEPKPAARKSSRTRAAHKI